MPWTKTDAGRLEMQTRALVQARAQRNLLLLADGRRSEEQLLASVTGTTRADLLRLQELGLIVQSDASTAAEPPAPASAAWPRGQVDIPVEMPTRPGALAPASGFPSREELEEPDESADEGAVQEESAAFAAASSARAPAPAAPQATLSFDHLSRSLTSIISSELGLRGFTLTLAVERAANVPALMEVAGKVLAQVEKRKGVVAAEKARLLIYGR